MDLKVLGDVLVRESIERLLRDIVVDVRGRL